jgi:integrase
MARLRTGCAIAKKIKKGNRTFIEWYARVQYFDATGKRIQKHQKPKHNTKTAARELAKDMVRDLEIGGPQSLDSSQMSFSELAQYYKETYLIEPEYIDGRKVAGLRNKYDYEKRLETLKAFFRKQKVRSITYGDLKRYRSTRLKTPVVVGRNTRGTEAKGNPTKRQRSIATVNRELSLLRRILNVAVENGWIVKNPFSTGASLITLADEKHRERILTKEEEDKLLAACTDWRAHLKPIIIMALDTGMRRGEMFKLKWADVDFQNRIITIHAFNTKTMRERQVAMSARLTLELRGLWEKSTQNRDDLVFGIETSVKTAFDKVKKVAGISDLRFHDLRHTHATRLVSKHLPLSEVGKALGHTQANTTFRYVNPNIESARRIAAIVDEFNNSLEEDAQR